MVGPGEGFGLHGARPVIAAMCIKPVYNTHEILHKLPIFIEHHLAQGVEHFVFYKQWPNAEPLTTEGLMALKPYLDRGILTVLELHPLHSESGIATAGVYDGGDPINAEELVGTHCLWSTRGLARWTFVHIDIDEFFTPVPFNKSALVAALSLAMLDSDGPPFALQIDHLRAELPPAPRTPLEVAKVKKGHDGTWGKGCYRPELVNVAWIHAPSNTPNDNNILSKNGQPYEEKSINHYMPTSSETYFLHFSQSHWDQYQKEHPGEGRTFSYPLSFQRQIVNSIRMTFVDYQHQR